MRKAAERNASFMGSLLRLTLSDDLRVHFVLGGTRGVPEDMDSLMTFPRQVHRDSTARARRAALCWMWAGLLMPYRHVMRRVGQLVYAFRRDPAVWGVKGRRGKPWRK